MKRVALVSVIALLAAMSAVAADLVAGKNTIAGNVTVSNAGGNLLVTYVAADTWRLQETHLHVALSPAEIPQKNGNPIPGKFEYSTLHSGLVTSFTYTIPLGSVSTGTAVYIAAHATMVDTGSITKTMVKSGDAVNEILLDIVTRSRAGNVPDFQAVNLPAVLAWVHPSWNGALTSQAMLNAGAKWIWETNPTQNSDEGTALIFLREFTLPAGYVMRAPLYLTCDNGYEAFVNGSSVATRGVFKDWRTSNLCGTSAGSVTCGTAEEFVYGPAGIPNGWNVVGTVDVAGQVVAGATNKLTLDAANARYPGGPEGNPGACIYLLDVETARTETGWGSGTAFSGANWATYITYTVQ